LNPQLIDAASDAHLWTERFNGDTSYLLTLQDEITSRIAAALNLELIGAEAARPPSISMLSTIFYGRAPQCRTQDHVGPMRRRFAYTSARWRSIRGLSRRRVGWRLRLGAA
jgi:hypothetical protein